MPSETISSQTIHTEKRDKRITVDLKRNARGVFFRITEDSPNKRAAIVFPFAVAAELAAIIHQIAEKFLQ